MVVERRLHELVSIRIHRPNLVPRNQIVVSQRKFSLFRSDHIVKIVVLAVASIIFLQSSQKNHTDETDEEKNHHE